MRPIDERKIPLLERVVITHLIKEDGRIAGAAGFRLDAEETVTIQAKVGDPVHRRGRLQAKRLSHL